MNIISAYLLKIEQQNKLIDNLKLEIQTHIEINLNHEKEIMNLKQALESQTYNINDLQIIIEQEKIKFENFKKQQIKKEQDFNYNLELKIKPCIETIRNLKAKLEHEKVINNNLNHSFKDIIELKAKLEKKGLLPNKCSICLENDLSICCIPCGHTYCDNCVVNTHNCYICRQTIIRTNRIYF